MAYNYYTGNYNLNNGVNPYYQQATAQQIPQTPQIRSTVVYTNSKDEAFNYPVAPGNSVFFINTTTKECYEKTAPLSPMEPFVFKVYDLVEKVTNNNQPEQKTGKETAYDAKAEIGAIWGEIKSIKEKLAKGTTEDV